MRQASAPAGEAHVRDAILALDTGSPVASLAISIAGGEPVERRIDGRRTSAEFFSTLRRLLDDLALPSRRLGEVLVVQGPGSFTGLRIGFAAALGLHQAAGLDPRAVPTLRVLASLAPSAPSGRPILALVDALRGEWFAQLHRFDDAGIVRAEGEARRMPGAELAAFGREAIWVGFGVASLVERLGADSSPSPPALPITAIEPRALAGAALRLAALDPPPIDPGLLGEPLYLRPAATRPSS